MERLQADFLIIGMGGAASLETRHLEGVEAIGGRLRIGMLTEAI